MKKYETLFLLPGDISEKIVQDATQKVTRLIRNHQSHIIKIDDWGKRKLAYPVQKQTRGHYIYVVFLAESDAISALERMMRLEAHIAKFHIVRLSDHLTAAQIDHELKSGSAAVTSSSPITESEEKRSTEQDIAVAAVASDTSL